MIVERPPALPKDTIKALYVGPFQLEQEVNRRRKLWAAKMEDKYDVTIEMSLATPPFHYDQIDCKGYWVHPVGKNEEAQVDQVREDTLGKAGSAICNWRKLMID